MKDKETKENEKFSKEITSNAFIHFLFWMGIFFIALITFGWILRGILLPVDITSEQENDVTVSMEQNGVENTTTTNSHYLEGTYRLILDTGIVYTVTFLNDGQALVEESTQDLSEVVDVLIMPCLDTNGITNITFLLEDNLSFEVLTQSLDNEELILVGDRGMNAWLRR